MPEIAEPADTAMLPGPDPHDDDVDGADDESQAVPEHRPHGSAWSMALAWAGLTAVALVPFALSSHPDRSVPASLATVVVPALAVGVVCALVASRSTSAWSWWLYPPIVVLPAVALVVLTDQVPDRMENVPAAGDQGNRSLAAPERAGDWTLQTGPSAEEQEAELRKRIGRADESLRAVYGEYRRPGDDVLVYNGINVSVDSDLARELIGRPEAALDDYLDGTGITDVVDVVPGDLSGAMACGTLPRLGPYVDLIVCGWADSGGIGTATYRIDGINTESAARTTRDFRAAVTVVG